MTRRHWKAFKEMNILYLFNLSPDCELGLFGESIVLFRCSLSDFISSIFVRRALFAYFLLYGWMDGWIFFICTKETIIFICVKNWMLSKRSGFDPVCVLMIMFKRNKHFDIL